MIIFNAAVVGFLWFNHWNYHHPNRNQQETEHMYNGENMGAGYIVKLLDFTQEQQKKLESLRKQHFLLMENYESQVNREETEIWNSLSGSTIDSNKAFANIDSLGTLKIIMQKELFRHFSSIRKLCTAEQDKKFVELVRNISGDLQMHHNRHKLVYSTHRDSL